MTIPLTDGLPKNRTEGLGNFVAMIHNALERGEVASAKNMLIDLWNDIGVGNSYECVERTDERTNFLPEYDEATDGDYTGWLIRNNMD